MKKTVIILAIVFLLIGVFFAIQYKINEMRPDIPKADKDEVWIDDSIVDTTKQIASIVDKTIDDHNIDVVKEKEVIYSDSIFEYYFETRKSGYVIVTYTDGTFENVHLALKHDRIKISDLTKFGIEYKKELKKSDKNPFFGKD